MEEYIFLIVIGVFTLYVVKVVVGLAISLIKSLFRLLMKMIIKTREEYKIAAISFTARDGNDHKDDSSSSMAVAALDVNMREKVAAVEEILCYTFKKKTLLQEALTHSSYTKSPSYKRLEFLGDAALGLAVADYNFKKYPKLNSGELTLLRAANVRNEKLARIALRLNLFSSVRHEERTFEPMINKFKDEVRKEEHDDSYHASVEAPDILADIVESIAGAVYMDCNNHLKTLWEVFKRIMEPTVTLETLHKQPQPVTLLYQLCQKQHRQVHFVYDNVRKIGSFSVDEMLLGSSSSGKMEIAKLNAAREALLKWECPLEINRD